MGVVESFTLRLGGPAAVAAAVEVRWGDDLGLLSSFIGVRHGLSDSGISKLLSALELRVPQHSSPEWIRARRGLDSLASRAAAPPVPAPTALDGCYLTVAITTCKRLPLFIKTVDSFLSSLGGLPSARSAVCSFLVVDDSSDDGDREVMKARYPEFEFVWKRPEEKGHARSMNMILDRVETRYLLYLEDDWLFLPGEGEGFEAIISAPLLALLSSPTLTQVLLNDQSSRACAYDDPPGLCLSAGGLGSAGWRREGYVEHEFASLHPNHQFSYWPGFSLNPAVWDLERLRAGLGEGGGGARFDEEDGRFEQAFSLRCHDVGLEAGHMPGVVVRHIGVEVSSYVLNGMERPFDDVQT